MTTNLNDLFANSYPAITVEKWTGIDGWPCFKVFIVQPNHRIQHGEDYQIRVTALAAAREYAAHHADRKIPIIDMTVDPHG